MGKAVSLMQCEITKSSEKMHVGFFDVILIIADLCKLCWRKPAVKHFNDVNGGGKGFSA